MVVESLKEARVIKRYHKMETSKAHLLVLLKMNQFELQRSVLVVV